MTDSEEQPASSRTLGEGTIGSGTLGGYSGKAETSREEPPEALEAIWESKAKLKDTPVMDLVELSENLRKARRLELGKACTALGCILLGAAAGAAVSGQRLDNKWVMLSGMAGLLFILMGALMWVNQTEKVATINQKLDIHLRTIKNQAAIERMKEIYVETDDDLIARLRRWAKRR